MYDIDRLGIGKVMELALEHLRHKERLHLSFDIDAVDPIFAPHTGTAVSGTSIYSTSFAALYSLALLCCVSVVIYCNYCTVGSVLGNNSFPHHAWRVVAPSVTEHTTLQYFYSYYHLL